MIDGKRKERNGPLGLGGPYASLSWNGKVTNGKSSMSTTIVMQRRVQERGPQLAHFCITGRVLEILSAQTCQKMTKSADTVREKKSQRRKRKRRKEKKSKLTTYVDLSLQ